MMSLWILGLMIYLALSFIGFIIKVCFYLSPLGLLFLLFRPRGYRRYFRRYYY